MIDTLSTCPIPSGEYPIGDNRFVLSSPAHTVTLQAFRIMKYAVSNELYTHFVRADGYKTEHYWTAMGWRWLQSKHLSDMLPYLSDPKFNDLAQPVVGVSWYEAQAFAAWLAENTPQTWRLPTEVEWEAAARGTGAIDTQNAHTASSFPHQPITMDSKGHVAWCGAYNLCGNVYEWCNTRWGRNWQTLDYRYPYQPDDEREDSTGSHARIMRGGSWFDNPQHAHPAARARYLPGSRGSNIGFRLVYTTSD